METRRPGQAVVQFGDVRGEAAADIADDLHTLDHAAAALGFKVRGGIVVGLSVYAGHRVTDRVSVIAQVAEGQSWEAIRQSSLNNGVLVVTEYVRHVPPETFFKCFRRFNAALFMRHGDRIDRILITDTIFEN